MPSKTIFVANLPFDVSEEQLGSTFSEVGPVQNVEIKFDPQTNKSKGYAFIHYYDPDTAASAVRNLHQVEVNGRNLRVELSTDEPPKKRRQMAAQGGSVPPAGGPPGYGHPGGAGGYGGGGPGPGGPGGRRDETPPMGRGGYGYDRPPVPGQGGPAGGYGAPGIATGGPAGGQGGSDGNDLSHLPPGVDVPPGQKATDVISKTLAAISPGQMQEVMADMKTLIATQPDRARQLLHSKPQLAYALFQAMLLLNIVDASVLQRINPLPPQSAPHAPPLSHQAPPAQQGYPGYPPAPAGHNAPSYPPAYPPQQPPQPPAQGGYRPPTDNRYGAPPPPQPQPPAGNVAPPIPPHAQAALATLPEDQRTMLMQVLSMTPDQIAALDATQQASIMQLRAQFLG